jgi:hypothetical protein
MGKPGGKRPLGRPRRRWEDVMKIDPQVVGWGCMDCIDRDRWQTVWNWVTGLRVL